MKITGRKVHVAGVSPTNAVLAKPIVGGPTAGATKG